MLMLVKDINIKSLTSGDKSARITLEVAYPEDIPTIAAMSELLEVNVEFSIDQIDKEEDKEYNKPS